MRQWWSALSPNAFDRHHRSFPFVHDTGTKTALPRHGAQSALVRLCTQHKELSRLG
jgi:hypothetical protein